VPAKVELVDRATVPVTFAPVKLVNPEPSATILSTVSVLVNAVKVKLALAAKLVPSLYCS